MALSPAQKAKNREATQLRMAAFAARQKEERDLIAKIDVSKLQEVETRAREKEDALLRMRDLEEAALRRQIAQLTDKLKAVAESYTPLLNEAQAARRAAYEERSREEEKLVRKIKDQFPDLDELKRMYAVTSASWNPPAGYIENFAKTYKPKKKAESKEFA